jgi:acetyl coenzyme A synthetase (ADP forming)-like protein
LSERAPPLRSRRVTARARKAAPQNRGPASKSTPVASRSAAKSKAPARGRRKAAAATESPVASHSLDALFRPRSVAVVGASRRVGSIGRQVVMNLVAGGFTGPVYPVNRSADVVMSMPSYDSVGAIPGPVDLAVICVPAAEVPAVVLDCGKKGVGGLVVITAGFREVGPEGAAREEEMIAITKRYGMRVIGPNCMGIVNNEPAFSLDASFTATRTPPGEVAMVSQSGALGEAILADAAAAGLGVSMFASIGNRADVTAADLIEYWEHAEQVKIILLYVENLGDPLHFVEVARRVGRTKPILAVKAGRSAAGAAAAGSHTGSVAGGDLAIDTLFKQCGVLRVESFREMFALTAALLRQPLPKGDRFAIVTNAGGPGILATDALDSSGLGMAKLNAATNKALLRDLPPEASILNPIDLIASADGARYRKALRSVVRDPDVDGLLVLFVSPIMIDAVAVAEAIVDETRGSKPVLVVLMGRQRGTEALAHLKANGIPVFRYPEDAARTMRMLVERGRRLARQPGKRPELAVDRAAAQAVLGERASGWLVPIEVETVLAAYGVPLARCTRVRTPGEAVAAAHEFGFPVVLKAESPKLLHKTEHQAVKVGLRDGDQVYAAAQDLIERLGKTMAPLSLVVQETAPGHREVLLGMTRDPRVGPLFAAGLGGTLVEVLRDLAFRIAPMDERDPAEMFASLKGAALLGEYRGGPPADVAAACDVLLRIQQLVLDFPRIAEIEVNPFILGAPGAEGKKRGASKGTRSLAVDARVRLADAGA